MIYIKKVLIIFISAGFLLQQIVANENTDPTNPPERMTYQGYLVDVDGNPLGTMVDPLDSTQRVSAPTNYDIVFRIYKAKQGDSLSIWSEQQTVTVDNGYFSVLLGQGSQFNTEPNGNLSDVFKGADISERYIGITVSGSGGTDIEIAPRLRLVASPYAFTATNARNVSDQSGNRNLFKVVDNNIATLKLGAGENATLSLPEGGGASLAGELTVNLPEWGDGLIIKKDSAKSSLTYNNDQTFSIRTDAAKFYLNKPIQIDGSILSHQRNTILGPSDNLDTYLKIASDSDIITAQADEYYIQGDNSYLSTKFSASSVEWLTDSSQFYMNKPLEVNGDITVSGTITGTPGPVYVDGSIGLRSVTGGFGNVQTVGGGVNGWEGYSIHSRYVFMSADNEAVGIYNDLDNRWLWYYDRSADKHSWYNDATARMQLHGSNLYLNESSARLGIGTSSPETVLHIPATNDAQLTTEQIIIGDFFGSPIYDTVFTDSGKYGVLMIGPRSGQHLRVDNNEIMAVDNNTTSTLHLNLNGGQVKVGSTVVSSDERLKHNIQSIKYGLTDLRQLRPVSYDWRLNLFNLPGTQLGFIAQEVQKVLPEVVSVEKGGESSRFKDELSLNVNGIMPVVVASVQELDNENLQLKQKVEFLQNELNSIKNEFELLKAELANKDKQEKRLARLEDLLRTAINDGQ